MAKNYSLSVGLERFMDRLPESRLIVLSSLDGQELLSVNKSTTPEDDSKIISLAVPSFADSVDQLTRLELGLGQYTLSWLSGCILMQVMIETLVVSILLNDSANIGILEELLPSLKNCLQPLFKEVNPVDTSR